MSRPNHDNRIDILDDMYGRLNQNQHVQLPATMGDAERFLFFLYELIDASVIGDLARGRPRGVHRDEALNNLDLIFQFLPRDNLCSKGVFHKVLRDFLTSIGFDVSLILDNWSSIWRRGDARRWNVQWNIQNLVNTGAMTQEEAYWAVVREEGDPDQPGGGIGSGDGDNADVARRLQDADTQAQINNNARFAASLGDGNNENNNQAPNNQAPRGRTRRRTLRHLNRSLTPRHRPRENRRRGLREPSMLNHVSGALRWINPFHRIWALFRCQSRARSGNDENSETEECKIPENAEDLPPLTILIGENGFPYSNDLIPGTKYTYGALRDALAENPRKRTWAEKTGAEGVAMQIHDSFKKRKNPEQIYAILQEFSMNSPEFRRMTGHAGLTAGDIGRLLHQTLTAYMRNSTSTKHFRQEHIDAVERLIISAIIHGETIDLGRRQINMGRFILSLIYFIGEMPPALQTRWAENFIQDNIEAYIHKGGCQLKDYKPGDEISCEVGAVERMMTNLHTEMLSMQERIRDVNAEKMHSAFEKKKQEELRKKKEIAASRLALKTQKRGPGRGQLFGEFYVGREGTLEKWIPEAQTEANKIMPGGEANPRLIRQFLEQKISENTDYHNTPDEWEESMSKFFTPEMMELMDFDPEYGNNWETASAPTGGETKVKKTPKVTTPPVSDELVETSFIKHVISEEQRAARRSEIYRARAKIKQLSKTIKDDPTRLEQLAEELRKLEDEFKSLESPANHGGRRKTRKKRRKKRKKTRKGKKKKHKKTRRKK